MKAEPCRYACPAYPECGCKLEGVLTPRQVYAAVIARTLGASGFQVHLPWCGELNDAEHGRWLACLASVDAIGREIEAAKHPFPTPPEFEDC